MAVMLVVDDREENLYLLRALLTGYGHRVDCAGNGAEALEQARRAKPDLVISDVLMPVMDGFMLCRQWHQDPILRSIPFVFYTATYTEPQDQQLALSLGADRFLMKPIDPADFMTVVSRVLDEYARGELQVRGAPNESESQYLRQYNAVLIEKLERKLSELEASNRLLGEKDAFNQAVINALAAPLAVLGLRGEIITVNQAWLRLVLSAGDPEFLRLGVGENVLASVGEGVTQFGLQLRQVVAGERPRFEFELSYGAPDTRWFMVRCEHVGAAGAAAVIVCIDVTERKRAQAALEEAAHRKDQFLALLGHELRNPLGPIMNSCCVLDKLPHEDARAARAREIINRQTDHLAHIVNDLLDVSRIMRNRMVMNRRPTNWTEIVRSTVADMRTAFAARKIELLSEMESGELWVDGDATRLAQVVSNLLDNAQKFSDPGGRVEIHLEAESRRWTRLLVRDWGIGMNPKTLTSIFQPYEQAPQDSARTRGGFGMGLALVRGLVELHGGQVSASSAGLGHGSEFVVRLPRVEAPALKPHNASQGRAVGTRVLLIEDNQDAASSLRTLLEMAGCLVQVASDGGSGMEGIRSFRPETVLCDIGLPGDMDGYAVARAVRADPALRGTRMIALTGYGEAGDRLRAQEAGFDVHLTKPAGPDVLLNLVAPPPPGSNLPNTQDQV